MSETQTEIKSAKCLSAEELAEIGELLGEILLALQSPLICIPINFRAQQNNNCAIA